MNKLSFLFAFIGALFVSAFPEEDDVLVLDDTNFEQAISVSIYIFISNFWYLYNSCSLILRYLIIGT